MIKLCGKLAVLALLLGGLFVPAAGAAVRPTVSVAASPRSIGAAGGRLTLKVTVHGATSCSFSSTPAVVGFAGRVKCAGGTVSRSGVLGLNSGGARNVHLKVTASSSSGSAIAQTTVTQAAAKPGAATIGSTLTASGSGQTLSVTLSSLTYQSPSATIDGLTATSGTEFVTICMTVKNVGSAVATGDAIADTSDVSSSGRNDPETWTGSLDGIQGCPTGMGNTGFTLQSGQSLTGGWAMMYPVGQTITSVSFSPSDGIGGHTATWKAS
jgi:hypothetical protein